VVGVWWGAAITGHQSAQASAAREAIVYSICTSLVGAVLGACKSRGATLVHPACHVLSLSSGAGGGTEDTVKWHLAGLLGVAFSTGSMLQCLVTFWLLFQCLHARFSVIAMARSTRHTRDLEFMRWFSTAKRPLSSATRPSQLVLWHAGFV
jgi:hypothetical protein